MVPESLQCLRGRCFAFLEKFFGLLLILLQAGAARQFFFRHTKLLPWWPGVRTKSGRKEDSQSSLEVRWALPFPRTGCALRAENTLAGEERLSQLPSLRGEAQLSGLSFWCWNRA